jgi:hypothetical protein
MPNHAKSCQIMPISIMRNLRWRLEIGPQTMPTHDKSCQIMTNHAKSQQIMTISIMINLRWRLEIGPQTMPTHDKSCQIMTNHAKSQQIMSNHDNLNHDKPEVAGAYSYCGLSYTQDFPLVYWVYFTTM